MAEMPEEWAEDENAEIPLGGGKISKPVRVGRTVRRTAGPWTSSVHALLAFLHERGFRAAPEPLGTDDKGREALTFVDGEGGTYPMPPYVWSDQTLVDAATLMRQLHDATVNFPLEGGTWRARAHDPGPREVICHSDWGPYNAVFRDGRLAAMVDWDFAGPGSRMWDLAWIAHSWVPLVQPRPFLGAAPADPRIQGARVRLLCDAYGVDDRGAFTDALWARVAATPQWIEDQAATGDTAFQSMADGGAANFYRRVLDYMDSIRGEIEAVL